MAEMQFNQAVIKGRVDDVHLHEGRHYHRVTMPAPDQYTKPQVCMVSANRRLSDPGKEIQIKVSIRGWARRFPRKDGSTGYDVSTSFEAIE